MGRIHPYGEPRTKDSPFVKFICWFFMVGLGFPMTYGWVFVWLGYVSNATLLMLSGGAGFLVAIVMALSFGHQKRAGKCPKKTN